MYAGPVENQIREVRRALDRAEQALAGYTPDDREATLRALAEVRAAAGEALDAAVARSRYLSDSWTLIGGAVGITKQSARERWAGNPGDQARNRELGRDPTWHLSIENPCVGCGASEDSYCECPGGPAAF